MKNVIEYYYNLHLNDIRQKEGVYSFSINSYNFVFLLYTRDLNELSDLYELSFELFKSGIPIHQFIKNKNNDLITYINSKPYILMQIICDEKKTITSEDIKKISELVVYIGKYKNISRNNWADLWQRKIDYFEYQINQFGKNKPLIRNSFSYYCGIVENGISLFNLFLEKNFSVMKYNKLSVCHKRLRKSDTLFDFYNPLNLIIDYKVRDICEYYKDLFVTEKKDIFNLIIDYITDKNLNQIDIYLFYIRMLYPSFYFDKYEDVITLDDIDINSINNEEVIVLSRRYEKLLKRLYQFLSNYLLMPDIFWLK